MHVERNESINQISSYVRMSQWRDFLIWWAAALLGGAISLKNFDLNQSPSKACLKSMMLMPLSVRRGAFKDLCGGTPWERSSCATRKIRIKGKTSPFIDRLCGLNLQTFFFSWTCLLNASLKSICGCAGSSPSESRLYKTRKGIYCGSYGIWG